MIKLQVVALFLVPALVWGQYYPTDNVYSTIPAAYRNQRSPYGNIGVNNPVPQPSTISNCRSIQQPNGGYKVTCDPRAAPSVRSEHILWLSGPQGRQQILDIEIPNYKINELIKAGFKGTPVSNTQVNLLLRRPEQSVESQVQPIGFASGSPQVNLKYEPVQPKLVHFPVDQPYSPLRGPLVPPPPKYSASNFDIV